VLASQHIGPAQLSPPHWSCLLEHTTSNLCDSTCRSTSADAFGTVTLGNVGTGKVGIGGLKSVGMSGAVKLSVRAPGAVKLGRAGVGDPGGEKDGSRGGRGGAGCPFEGGWVKFGKHCDRTSLLTLHAKPWLQQIAPIHKLPFFDSPPHCMNGHAHFSWESAVSTATSLARLRLD